MIILRNKDDKEDALLKRVVSYISRLGYYKKPANGIPASDLAGWVLPSAVTDNAVGSLGYTKNEGTVTGAKVNNVFVEPEEDGTVDIGTVVTDVSGKADINSPTFTGTPKAPTPAVGTNNTQIATTAFVTTAVADGIASITGMEYSIVAELPASGEAGVIYLISNSGSSPNVYDEYIWVNSAFELIGTTQIDLSNYVQKSQTSGLIKNDGTIDTNTYLTSAPVTSVNGQTGAVTITIPANTSDLNNDSNFISTSSTAGLVKNDGTIDTNTYLTSSALSGYVQTSSTTGLIKNDGSIDTNTYLTSAPVTSVNGQTGAVTLSIPSAPGTLDTTATTAQSTSSSEALSGSVTLHKVAKTGTYSDLIGKPTIPDVTGKEDTTNKVTSLSSASTDTQYPSAKCVYDLVGDIETLLAAI